MNPLLFTDFEEFASAIQEVDLRVRLLHAPRAAQRTWSIQELNLQSLRLQFVEEGSALQANGVMHQDGWGLYVQLSGVPASVNGQRFSPGDFVVLPPAAEFCISAHGPVKWFSVFVPSLLLADLVEPPRQSSSVYVTRGSSTLFKELRSQVSYVHHCAEKSGLSHLCSPDFDLMQDELLSSLLAIMTTHDLHRPKVSTRNSHRLVSQAIDLIENHSGLRLSIHHLSAKLDVSERTLQYAFQDQFDVSPKEFLIAYRLHNARRDLLRCKPEQTTVGAIATKHGFFDFGRFASKYLQFYGERPSATLRRRRS